jgi:hypothetical protein
MTLNQILIKAGKRGVGGGVPGAIAGAVCSGRNTHVAVYQCRYNGTTLSSSVYSHYSTMVVVFRAFIHRGLSVLLYYIVQAPLSRLVSTYVRLPTMEWRCALDWQPLAFLSSSVVGARAGFYCCGEYCCGMVETAAHAN